MTATLLLETVPLVLGVRPLQGSCVVGVSVHLNPLAPLMMTLSVWDLLSTLLDHNAPTKKYQASRLPLALPVGGPSLPYVGETLV